MIVFDLEWNNGYGNLELDEIVQIGAVRYDCFNHRISDTFHAFIKPTVHEKLSPSAKLLPDIGLSLASEQTFPSAYEKFLKWCEGEKEFGTWGNADISVLHQNAAHWGSTALTYEKLYDIQASFSEMVSTRSQTTLSSAIEYCRIPMPFVFHNALHDALYTAMIVEMMKGCPLVEAGTLKAKNKNRKTRFSNLSFKPKNKKKVGPFVSLDSALNSRPCRILVCPICGQRIWIRQWRFIDPYYLADFTCSEHGCFLCRLTLHQTESGEWRGNRAVPALTPELIEQFESHKDETYFCRANRLQKKKKYWRIPHQMKE